MKNVRCSNLNIHIISLYNNQASRQAHNLQRDQKGGVRSIFGKILRNNSLQLPTNPNHPKRIRQHWLYNVPEQTHRKGAYDV